MKLTIKQNAFGAELAHIQAIALRKHTIPITGNVLISAEPMSAVAVLSATDLEIALRIEVLATIDTPGSTTIPAHKLGEIVKALSSGCDVTLEVDKAGGSVKLKGGDFVSKIQTLPVEDFPTLPVQTEPTATIKAGDLLKLISRTRFAVGGEDTRFYMNGAKFEVGPTSVKAIATDGHRLSVAMEACSASAPCDAILPRKTLDALVSLVDKVPADSDVTLSVAENHLFFGVGPRVLTSRKIDGQFPAYEKIIPSGLPIEVVCNRVFFHEALKRVALIGDKRIQIAIDGEEIEITANTADGEAREVITSTVKASAKISMALNPRYVLDFVEASSDVDVRVSLKNETTQLMFAPEGQPDAFKYVVMPLR